MNRQERQGMMNKFQKWIRCNFLPEEEKIKERKLTQVEWEGHFNRLSSVFAFFVLCDLRLEHVPLHDGQAILGAYGDHLRVTLEQRWLEGDVNPSPDERAKEAGYYFWPVSLFISGEKVAAENN